MNRFIVTTYQKDVFLSDKEVEFLAPYLSLQMVISAFIKCAGELYDDEILAVRIVLSKFKLDIEPPEGTIEGITHIIQGLGEHPAWFKLDAPSDSVWMIQTPDGVQCKCNDKDQSVKGCLIHREGGQ